MTSLGPIVLVLACVVVSRADDPSKDPSANFRTTTRRKDDVVRIQQEKEKTVFAITSPTGISQATIERVQAAWPGIVVLRLHLKGLENFRISNGKIKLEAAVSTQEGKARVWKDGKEDMPLDEKSPFGIDIRIIGADGKPTRKLPLPGGYFELVLPRALFQDNPKSITLNWIDFYRN